MTLAHGSEQARSSNGPAFRIRLPELRLPELEAQGEQTLTLLLNTMLHPPSNTSLLILLTTCTSLGKQRPQLASTLSSTLCELQRRLVARSSALAALQQETSQTLASERCAKRLFAPC